MKALATILATLVGVSAPAFALAEPAWLTTEVGLMAGPDDEYPLIDSLPAGIEVDVQGCTDGWEWCDVLAGDERGWVSGDALQFDDRGQWVPLPEYAPSYGVPIVTFVIGNYWDRYYRYQPFYSYRHDWYRWSPPPRNWRHGPWSHRPPPRVMPLPHPTPNRPPRVVPMPHPILNPPPRVVPMPHPTPNRPPVVRLPPSMPNPPPMRGQPWPRQTPTPPPRVVPMPHPTPNPPALHAPQRITPPPASIPPRPVRREDHDDTRQRP